MQKINNAKNKNFIHHNRWRVEPLKCRKAGNEPALLHRSDGETRAICVYITGAAIRNSRWISVIMITIKPTAISKRRLI
jgi:hypothetical protein